ncbi:PAS domain S-box-containing protein [Desulfotomaculum arcticum]|uniref:histidine kinase n=1 Tax=Desulfotruncus arcticus DSM 17038 TaxID=1121424 RepID=A0A1I2VWE5_9FIRM|nr:ATP-binding protein [Desulfotruncus arcticus]SFG93474.1 PAS domain S-box-containing protein [Desulfotomaculum arcticum] [Desulfotruncus arcticus DSM 17038]
MTTGKMIQREKELQEYLITTHMLCLLIMISSLVLSNKFYVSSQIYPVINLRFFILAGLVTLGIVFIFQTKKGLFLSNINTMSLTKTAYLSFPLVVTVVTLLAVNNSLENVDTILLLPILVVASMTGKTGGLLMSTLCSFILILYNVFVVGNLNIYQAMEKDLLFIGMMYVMGWFVGSLTNMEAGHRRHLHRSLHSLKEEIASREKAEEQLRVLSCAVEQSPVMVVIADTDGIIQYVNNSFSRITGHKPEDVTGKEIVNYYSSRTEALKQLAEIVKTGQEWKGEISSKKENGESYWENAYLSPLRDSGNRITHILKFAEDITERKKMEKEMARLERLNLVGEMAASIGHEIRNPMTTVRGFLQILSGKDECRKYKEYYDLMIQELDRANSIIKEYLSLAKNRSVDYKMYNLTDIIQALSPLITADAINSNIILELNLQPVPDLMLDEKEIRQLLLNLVRNGLDAMKSGGRLTIRTFINEDAEVVLSIQDQGCGIAQEIVDKIGTPFFTTKEEGTGLGLAVCYSIAVRHNATIKLDSNTGGTTFYIVFKRK